MALSYSIYEAKARFSEVIRQVRRRQDRHRLLSRGASGRDPCDPTAAEADARRATEGPRTQRIPGSLGHPEADVSAG